MKRAFLKRSNIEFFYLKPMFYSPLMLESSWQLWFQESSFHCNNLASVLSLAVCRICCLQSSMSSPFLCMIFQAPMLFVKVWLILISKCNDYFFYCTFYNWCRKPTYALHQDMIRTSSYLDSILNLCCCPNPIKMIHTYWCAIVCLLFQSS